MLFRLENKGDLLEEIKHPDICESARFILEKPLIIDKDMTLAIIDGQFWVLQSAKQLKGHWKING